MNINKLRETRTSKITQMRVINEAAMNDNRDLRESERSEFDALDKEVRSLNEQIDRADKMAAFERLEEPAETVGGSEMQREMRNYSLAKATSESMNGQLTGLEAEVNQELGQARQSLENY